MTRAVLRRQSLLFGAVLLFAGSGTAFAQQNTPNEEVTIEGTDTIHNVHREIYGPPFREVFNIAVSHTVNYSDLDLTKDWGRELLSHSDLLKWLTMSAMKSGGAIRPVPIFRCRMRPNARGPRSAMLSPRCARRLPPRRSSLASVSPHCLDAFE